MPRKFRQDPLKYALHLASLSFVANIVLLLVVGLMWNSYGNIGNIDAAGVALTTIEIFLVIVALGGFWILRGHVQSIAFAASQEAAEDAFTEYKPYLRRQVEELVRAELEERPNVAANRANLDFKESSYDIAKAMDDENGGNDD